MRKPEDPGERKAIDDVTQHGWHVLKVLGDAKGPEFAYVDRI
jgi:hypothetical protein